MVIYGRRRVLLRKSTNKACGFLFLRSIRSRRLILRGLSNPAHPGAGHIGRVHACALVEIFVDLRTPSTHEIVRCYLPLP